MLFGFESIRWYNSVAPVLLNFGVLIPSISCDFLRFLFFSAWSPNLALVSKTFVLTMFLSALVSKSAPNAILIMTFVLNELLALTARTIYAVHLYLHRLSWILFYFSVELQFISIIVMQMLSLLVCVTLLLLIQKRLHDVKHTGSDIDVSCTLTVRGIHVVVLENAHQRKHLAVKKFGHSLVEVEPTVVPTDGIF